MMKRCKYGNKFVSGIKRLISLWVVIFLLAGCGNNVFEGIADDSSYEALIEEAKTAIDDEDYAKARDILLGMDQGDSMVAQYLSNAYAGLAGLDTFTLLETIDNFTASNTGDIDMVGNVLGGSDSTLTLSEIKSKKSNLDNAITILKGIATLKPDQEVQLGIFSLNAGALLIGERLTEVNGGAVTLTKAGIKNLNPPTFTLQDATDFTNYMLPVIAATATIIDITGNINNDLSDNLNQFVDDVGGNDGDVTMPELDAYINSLI